ncbi:MAG: X-Pro aminopeptidase [Flavobacteriaceae bacterium TMED179]|nr:MAG: X-Pro aminopeptidase [Flavobacteriaceae bacterium TMED179]|tara:strand:- start:7483 stop:8778 length:1296 start_codon:yes stop_codon:yes gene_type:complete
MKYKPLSSSFYTNTRKAFIANLKPNSLAVFNSNDIYPVGADSTLPFEQHRDIFYLSGIDQEESILILFPGAFDKKHREILFVRKTDKQIAIWEGPKLNKIQAKEISGIQTIYWLEEFEKIFKTLSTQCETFYLNTNEHYRQTVETQTREDRFIQWCKKEYPVHSTEKSNPILQKLRSIKSNEEIKQLQTACDITEIGIRRILSFLKPGVWEYELEAELIYEFLRNRSKGFAYDPIIASGANANILHYTDNNQQCKAGELVLLDVAAEYGNYSADLTRTLPISGNFTKRQKAVYNAVLKVKNEATKLLIPGTIWKEFHVEVGKIMTSELLGLGLLDKADIQNEKPESPSYKKYFMHGTAHHLGLNTHDYGLLHLPMEANMVFTVEPGIYIPEEGFGIRLEDDVVIQKSGVPKNLTANIPIEIEEIESLMNTC